MQPIRVGIVGYGNLGKGVEYALRQNGDMELVCVFTRREPGSLKLLDPNVKVQSVNDAKNYADDIDVMILCGGSATDLPRQGPHFATMFNTVDSFDIHASIPEYYEAMHQPAESNGKTSIISVGWDPGLFSINRMMAEAILPEGKEYTFWGKGISQGHSVAIRRVPGVKAGVQYTIPIEDAINQVRRGEEPELTAKERHLRDCYVVAEEGADKAAIEKTIKNMPNYFSDYDVNVTFISEEELKANHSGMSHGGFVIRSGRTGTARQIIEYSLKLESNPEFTSNVLVAYARAAFRLNREGRMGAFTVFDVPPAYLSPKPAAELIRTLL
jgi:diaminopimelate dehydrogenase